MSDFIFLDSKITVGGDYSFLIVLTIGAFVGKIMSLLFNMPSSFVMGFPGGSVFKNVPMQERQIWSRDWEVPLEKEMATHSHILAWEIPWREEPGGLQSIGSQQAERDWSDLACNGTGCHDLSFFFVFFFNLMFSFLPTFSLFFSPWWIQCY